MKILETVFLSFTTKENYLELVQNWKNELADLENMIKLNKTLLPVKQQQLVEYNNVYADYLELIGYQQTEKFYASLATKMYRIRRKMKRLAGKQSKARWLREQEQLVSV